MTKAPHKVVLPGQAGEAVADALLLPVVTPEMIEAAERALMAAISGEVGPNWPFARLTAEEILKAAMQVRGAPS